MSLTKQELCDYGIKQIRTWCRENDIKVPDVVCTARKDWRVGSCAYYQRGTINICVEGAAE